MVNYKKFFGVLAKLYLLLFVFLAPFSTANAETIVLSPSGTEILKYSDSHALLIGISDYDHWKPLPGVADDIRKVAVALSKHSFTTTIAENVSRAQLLQIFNDFTVEYGQKEHARLLVYFAGHGHTRKSQLGEQVGYIVPKDTPNPASDEKGFIDRAIHETEIQSFMGKIESKHAFFIFDSCFSGSLITRTRSSPDVGKLIGASVANPVHQYMTSGAADQLVPDDSLFRAAFIQAIEGEGDSNGDGYVTAQEIDLYVSQYMGSTPLNKQTPQFGERHFDEKRRGDFVFKIPLSDSQNEKTEISRLDLKKKVKRDTTERTIQENSNNEKKIVSGNVIQENDYLLINIHSNSLGWKRGQIFINSDQEFSTGFAVKDGADYLIEGDRLYKYDKNSCSSNTDSWCWKQLSEGRILRDKPKIDGWSYTETWKLPVSEFKPCPEQADFNFDLVSSRNVRLSHSETEVLELDCS